MKTIALYGGSFDPPHIGHEAVVKALLSFDTIDKVVIMPTFLNPFKEKFFAPAEMRFVWLKKIFYGFTKVEISSFEIDKKRKIPSLESVEYLLQTYRKIYLVIGADNLSSLKEWHNIETLKSKVTFLVASRAEIEIPKNFLKLDVDVTISSSELRKNMNKTKLPKAVAASIVQYYKDKNER